jgi:hypothetical protein
MPRLSRLCDGTFGGRRHLWELSLFPEARLAVEACSLLEHDPEKIDTGFPKRSCSIRKKERDD